MKKRVLFITHKLNPFTDEDDSRVHEIIPKLYNKGYEIRVLMPKYGNINERRHKLHEVVRLSGMNIIVEDEDYPLIIKVASMAGSRMQVYFLDNEDFFKRKNMFQDDDGKVYEDNSDRMVFFCKGVIETVKKFGWAPDIIHMNGWFTSLIPFYLKTVYRDTPVFENSKTIFSLNNDSLEESLDSQFYRKALINELIESDIECYRGDVHPKLTEAAISYVDGIVQENEQLNKINQRCFDNFSNPKLSYFSKDEIVEKYIEFYTSLLQ